MEKSESLNKLAIALIKVQGAIKKAEKGSENPFFHSKYADLESCWEAVKEPLQDNHLAVTQFPAEFDGVSQGLTTMLIHESGEYISQFASIPLSKKDPHGAGSGITYLRRYGLSSVLGLLAVDDDGNGATKDHIKKGKGHHSGTDGSFEGLEVEEQSEVEEIATAISKMTPQQGHVAFYASGFDGDKQTAIWQLLKEWGFNDVRKAISKIQKELTEDK